MWASGNVHGTWVRMDCRTSGTEIAQDGDMVDGFLGGAWEVRTGCQGEYSRLSVQRSSNLSNDHARLSKREQVHGY